MDARYILNAGCWMLNTTYRSGCLMLGRCGRLDVGCWMLRCWMVDGGWWMVDDGGWWMVNGG